MRPERVKDGRMRVDEGERRRKEGLWSPSSAWWLGGLSFDKVRSFHINSIDLLYKRICLKAIMGQEFTPS